MKISDDHRNMLSTCIQWLNDWTHDMPPLLDEADLTQWMEDEMRSAIQEFVHLAFRKTKTRTQVLEIMRALCWEYYEFQRHLAVASLPEASTENDEAVRRLLHIPQTAQKSAAWHAEARELLTGHEFGTVVNGTENAIEAVVAKKCAPEISLDTSIGDSRTVFVGKLSPFQWGWRFEPVIRSLFEQEIAKGRVDDTLGRIRHPTLPRLAASPDGLICDGPRQGRLVEIKAPISRQITGELPADYYCQMQLQAEVTGAPAVEYIEMKIHNRIIGDPTNPVSASELTSILTPRPHGMNKMGCVLVVGPPDDPENPTDPMQWRYEYSDSFKLSCESWEILSQWRPANIPAGWEILERSIWTVDDFWTTTVLRNSRWWDEVGYPAYIDFWKRVETARAEGRYRSTLLLVDSDGDSDDDEDFMYKKN
jgi:hypothetical protein